MPSEDQLDFPNDDYAPTLPDLGISSLLDYFEEYISSIERFLEEETKAIQNKVVEPDPREDFLASLLRESEHEEQKVKLENFFPDILRKSVFVAIWSAIETALNMRCDLVRKNKKLAIAVKALRGDEMERCWTYLTKLAGITLPKVDWDNLQDYGKLRNCLVHNQGRLTGCRDEKDLRKYIPKQKFLEFYGDVVTLKSGYCEEFIKDAKTFFEKLDYEVR